MTPATECASAARLFLAGAVLAVAVFGAPWPARALDWSAAVSAGHLNTDNLDRTEGNERESDISTAELDLAALTSTRSLDIDVMGTMHYRDYSVAGVDNDRLSAINALLQWRPVEDRFAWTLTENKGQLALNSNDGLRSSDRQDVNVVATGPDVRFPLGSANALLLAGRYSLVDYERSPFDNDRTAGRIAYERAFSAGVLSLNFSRVSTRYDDRDRDADLDSTYLGYRHEGERGTIDASAGMNRVDDGASTSSGFFADLGLVRTLSPQSWLFVDAVHRIADSADVFRHRQSLEADIEDTIDVIATDQAFEESSFSATYGWSARRTNVSATVFYLRDRYFTDTVSADRSGYGTYLHATFAIRPRLALEGRLEWRREAPELERTLGIEQKQFSVTWHMLRTVNLEFGAERYTRTHSVDDYDETRYFVMLEWRRDLSEAARPIGLDSAARRRMNLPR